jgi:hypothetical protein
MQRLWRAETGIFLGLWLVLMIGGRERLFRDPGAFWHTAAGHWILSHQRLPQTDWMSFTRAGQPWVAYEWLGECAMALVHAIDGLDSLLLATVTVLAGLYTWVAYRLIRSGLHWSLTIVVLLLTLGASSSHFHARPHLFTFVFFAWTCAWLIDFERARISLAHMFWLVPVYVVWTNIHGGVLGGLGTLGLAWFGWIVYRLLKQPSPLADPGRALGFAGLPAACTLAILVNPYGVDLPRTWLLLVRSDVLPQIIIEHAPLDPRSTMGQMTLAFALVYSLALIGVWPRWPRVTWLIPFVWLFLAASRVRHAPLFALSAVLALADFLPETRWARWLAEHRPDLFQPPDLAAASCQRRHEMGLAMLLPNIVVLVALFLQAFQVRVPVLGHGWARPDPQRWPVALLDRLQEYERRQPRGTPIFNDFNLGGFVIYYTPGLRVFVDDRCELYGPRWLKEEFLEVEQSDPGRIEQWSRQYGFDHALVQNGRGFDLYLRTAPDWELIERDPTAALYRKKPDASK